MKILNVVAFTGFLFLILKLLIVGQDGDGGWNDMFGYTKILFVWGMLGGVFLWISMLIDHFKYSRTSKKVLWGLSLVFFQFFAAMVYFILVYAPANYRIKGLIP